MNPAETKIEKFQEMVGYDISYDFERQIAEATLKLAESLKENYIDNDQKVNYATHVFAKTLDELADMLDLARLLN